MNRYFPVDFLKVKIFKGVLDRVCHKQQQNCSQHVRQFRPAITRQVSTSLIDYTSV